MKDSNSIKLLSLVLSALCRCFLAGTPAPARFFPNQLVDHLQPCNTTDTHKALWTQRYYVWEEHFQGPGSPIFLILGGEGAVEPTTGLFYPFITHHLAKSLGAFVLEPEHRFYGDSQPISRETIDQARFHGREDPRVRLLTSEQALRDAIRLLTHIKQRLGCQPTGDHYCPVITVGGSYPGFLSAMARVVFPQHVDMAYAASAPMRFYSQTVSQDAYYNHITKVAEKTHPGCAAAVLSTLQDVETYFLETVNFETNAAQIGLCEGTVPDYIQDTESFLEEVFMMCGYTFANLNMQNYPPSNQTRLYKACETFDNPDWTSLQKLQHFLVDTLAGSINDCVDMRLQLPAGPRATLSSGDWSGVGSGTSGESWDFQTCTLLIEAIAFGNKSMFPPRPWSLDWMQNHCQARFGVTPLPKQLVDKWQWDKLVEIGASRILFTNGLNDGWSVSGIQHDLSKDLLALNFPNGAHHSDLSGRGPSEDDTDDVRQGFQTIEHILTQWVGEVKASQSLASSA